MTPVPVPPPLPPLIDVQAANEWFPALFVVAAIPGMIALGVKLAARVIQTVMNIPEPGEKAKRKEKFKNEMPWEREARKQVAWALFRAHYPLQPEHLELLNLSNQYLAEHGYFADGTPMDSIVGTVEMTIGDDGELVEINRG